MMVGARFEKKMSKVLLAFQQLCVNCFVTTLKIYCSQPAAPMRRVFQTRGKFWQVHAFLQFQGKKGGPSSFQIPTLTFVSVTSDIKFNGAEFHVATLSCWLLLKLVWAGKMLLAIIILLLLFYNFCNSRVEKGGCPAFRSLFWPLLVWPLMCSSISCRLLLI